MAEPGAAPGWAVRAAAGRGAWRAGLEPAAERERARVPAPAAGARPPGLAGRVLWNGPGRVRVGAVKHGHWFDGDGMVHALDLGEPGGAAAEGVVRYSARFVRTERFKRQEAAGEAGGMASKGAWTRAGGGASFWGRARERLPDPGLPGNPSNTSVLSWGGRLLALCEGGPAMELDPVTLETLSSEAEGGYDFGGQVQGMFSAHGKVCPCTGELFNFGLGQFTPGRQGLQVWRLPPPEGALPGSCPEPPASTFLPFKNPGCVSFVHDCALSTGHLVFVIPPWVCPDWKATASIVGLAPPFGHCFEWREELGTRLVVLDRATLKVAADLQVPRTFSTYHFANAFEQDGRLTVLVNSLNGSREGLERQFSDMYAASFGHETTNTLTRLVLDLETGELLEDAPAVQAGVSGSEFPVIHPDFVGRRNRFVYTSAVGPGSTSLNAVQKIDLETGEAQQRNFEGQTIGESVFIPKARGGGGEAGEGEEDAGYLLVTAFVHATRTTDLVLLDAEDVTGEPVCVWRLPWHIPYTFHAHWEDSGGSCV